MISSLIDELRKSADGQAPYRDARAAMLEAADTIWQLRDDLQRANEAVRDAEHDESRAWDRVRKAEAENAKLRELVADTLGYYAMPNNIDYKREAALLERARELGAEVEQ